WTGIDFDAELNLSCVDASIQYVSASREEDVAAEARTLRRGGDLIFLDVTVRAAAGKPLVHGALTYQASDYAAGHAPRLRAEPVLLGAPSPLIAPPARRLFHGSVDKLGITPQPPPT